MHKIFTLVLLFIASFSLSAQELVDQKKGKGTFLDLSCHKIGSFYYQIGVFDNSITVGFDNETQVITEIGNNKKDQIYVVKYDLELNIVWATAIGLTNNASKVQIKKHEDYLYIFSAQVNSDKTIHYCHRINIDDPDDVDYVLRFETGSPNAEYRFDISPAGALAVAGTYTDRVKFIFNGQADKEYFCNSEQNLFLVRYRLFGAGHDYSHIVQREWGHPGPNERNFYAVKFDPDENIHLFGGAGGSAQLDGNLGEAIGQSATFQLSYTESDELIQFKKTNFGSFNPGFIIPINNNNYAFVGGTDYVVLSENMEVISTNPYSDFANRKVLDVAVTDKSFTALYEFPSSIYPVTLDGYKFKSHSLDYAFINYDFEGNMNWYSYFGGDSSSDLAISLDYLDNGNLLFCGNTIASLDIDPTHNVVKYDFEVNRFLVAEYSMICNGLSAGEKNISQITCTEDAQIEFGVKGGTSPYQFYFDDQLVTNFTDIEVAETGVYEAYVIDDENCSKSIHIPITGPSVDPDEKLKLHLHAEEFRTGFESHIFCSLNNLNCIPKSGKIKFILDDQLEYLGSSQTPSSVNEQIFEFDYDALIYKESILNLKLDLRVSVDAVFGDYLCARIYVYDDQGTEVDRDIICKEVINSYDPNDISVAPYGRCEENYILDNEELEYTIRFQNLGNAEAINIRVVDTLSAALDINSIITTGTSHEAIVHIEEDSILIINYYNINLPAKEQDEEASNGFFSYKIDMNPNQALNTKIYNRAAIFFDFNDPVITNTVRSTIIDVLPVCILTGVNDIEKDAPLVFPNPAMETLTIAGKENSKERIQLFDISGRQYDVAIAKSHDQTVLDLIGLQQGIYFVKVGGRVIRIYKN